MNGGTENGGTENEDAMDGRESVRACEAKATVKVQRAGRELGNERGVEDGALEVRPAARRWE
jgi:hypothetical protein